MMTMKEKLATHRQIETENREALNQWRASRLTPFEVKAYETETGLTRHITGSWPDPESMILELAADGFIIENWRRMEESA